LSISASPVLSRKPVFPFTFDMLTPRIAPGATGFSRFFDIARFDVARSVLRFILPDLESFREPARPTRVPRGIKGVSGW